MHKFALKFSSPIFLLTIMLSILDPGYVILLIVKSQQIPAEILQSSSFLHKGLGLLMIALFLHATQAICTAHYCIVGMAACDESSKLMEIRLLLYCHFIAHH